MYNYIIFSYHNEFCAIILINKNILKRKKMLKNYFAIIFFLTSAINLKINDYAI